jgi:hypothetical protein
VGASCGAGLCMSLARWVVIPLFAAFFGVGGPLESDRDLEDRREACLGSSTTAIIRSQAIAFDAPRMPPRARFRFVQRM